MASSKRPVYKVETKLTGDRKRRKSDLVIMWQSIWGVTIIIAKELWMTVIRMWEFIQLWFSSSDRFLIQTWLEKHLPYVPEDFSESWRDGRLLAFLLNKLRPGCFPDANRLDSDYGLKNVYRIFDALEIYFGIKPNVSVEEIVTCCDGSDIKLIQILLELKNLTDNQPENPKESEPEPVSKANLLQSSITQSCVAKGIGLSLGFVGKTTNFTLHSPLMSNLDVFVAIRGPSSICSERITKRSPRKKRSVCVWDHGRTLTRSLSFNEEDDGLVTEDGENVGKRVIPFKYEIVGDEINLSYKPIEKGKHKVTILWHGQHVSDSPYYAFVKESQEVAETNNVVHLKSALKATNESGKNEVSENVRKISVRFQESEVKCEEPKGISVQFPTPSSKIIRRKVIRYIVKIYGKDIPVKAENTEALATELLKMDYDFETCPSSHRRNSWGFTGDAQRKKSAIRQFGVDVSDLDAQISHRRSHSLSLNSGSKKLLLKSDSFESLTSNLNILNEDSFENCEKVHEDERDYAYLNEDELVERKMGNEVKYDDVDNINYRKSIVQKTSELTESDFAENSEKFSNWEITADQVSSLSIAKIDNLNEDLKSDHSLCTSTQICCGSNLVNTDKITRNSENSSTTLHSQGGKSKKSESRTSTPLQITPECEIISENSKVQKCSSSNVKYNNRAKRKNAIPSNQFVYRKVSRSKRPPVTLSPIRTIKNNRRTSRHLWKTVTPEISSNFDETKRAEKSKDPKLANECGAFNASCQHVSDNSQIIAQNDFRRVENNTSVIEGKYIKNQEQKKLAEVNPTFRNIINPEETKDTLKSLNPIVHESQSKISDFNQIQFSHTTSAPSFYNRSSNNVRSTKPLQIRTPQPIRQHFANQNSIEISANLVESEVETKVAKVEKTAPLQIHTLKTIENFTFKQFKPRLETENSDISVKFQIGLWERTQSSENENTSLQRKNSSDTEQVSVKEKLAFWENASKSEQNPSEQKSLENSRKLNFTKNKKSFISFEGNFREIKNDLQDIHSKDDKSNFPVSNVNDKTEICNSINKETNVGAKKQTEGKISAEFQLSAHKIRSLSDPVTSDTATEEPEIFESFSDLQESSKRPYSSSSTDDNLEQFELDDYSEDSGGDFLLQSTEDEYIDDEISERASEYWGDLSIVKGWKVSRSSNENSISADEFLQSFHKWNTFPEECKVFGIAVYYGYVSLKNRFKVYTGDAGFGNLSASVQGSRQHDVSLVSVSYVRKNIYEVTYQVMSSGYYLISIRWLDKEIPGSPFVCKVTF